MKLDERASLTAVVRRKPCHAFEQARGARDQCTVALTLREFKDFNFKLGTRTARCRLKVQRKCGTTFAERLLCACLQGKRRHRQLRQRGGS